MNFGGVIVAFPFRDVILVPNILGFSAFFSLEIHGLREKAVVTRVCQFWVWAEASESSSRPMSNSFFGFLARRKGGTVPSSLNCDIYDFLVWECWVAWFCDGMRGSIILRSRLVVERRIKTIFG